MTALGQFRPDPRDDSRRVFVVQGSDLTVEESSVSSDWTSESSDVGRDVEEERFQAAKQASNFHHADAGHQQAAAAPAAKGKKKKRVRSWRVRHSLAKHRHLRDEGGGGGRSSSSSSRSSESSSSTGSDSESKSDDDRPPEQRRSRNARRMASTVLKVDVQRERPDGLVSSPLRWARGSKKHRHLAFAFGFLDQAEIAALSRAAAHPTVKEIHDRKAYLAFKHRVVRFEMQLRALEPSLYAKLLALMRRADTEGWRKLRKKKDKVYPEVEYIEYDVKREGGQCFIEPHVDNKSGVTLVAMLSPRAEYEGGASCFRRGKGTEGHRQISLDQGDVVMFRGERLLHWITNVTSGRRVILQIELSRV